MAKAIYFKTAPISVRLWGRSQIVPAGCRIFCGTITGGYGRIYHGGKQIGAHRAAWIETYGPIPPGMCVLHRCDVPSCINPDHLFLGTNLDNIADKMAKRRHRTAIGVRHWNARLTPETVIAIFNDKRGCNTVAAAFGVSKTHVKDIRHGRVWWHVTGATRTRQ